MNQFRIICGELEVEAAKLAPGARSEDRSLIIVPRLESDGVERKRWKQIKRIPWSLEQMAANFWARINVERDELCWNWRGPCSPSGYGRATFRRWPWRAHRLAWFFTHGNIPSDKIILHHCDNRKCCNPSHLYIGTWQDNMNDRSARGRCNPSRGSQSVRAVLNETQVVEIKMAAKYRTRGFNRLIAKKYGVHETTISAIVNNYNWKHLCVDEEHQTV
jgi:hypothetical protein